MKTTTSVLIEEKAFTRAWQSFVLFVPAADQSGNMYWPARQHICTSRPAIARAAVQAAANEIWHDCVTHLWFCVWEGWGRKFWRCCVKSSDRFRRVRISGKRSEKGKWWMKGEKGYRRNPGCYRVGGKGTQVLQWARLHFTKYSRLHGGWGCRYICHWVYSLLLSIWPLASPSLLLLCAQLFQLWGNRQEKAATVFSQRRY